jgi:thiamine-phosphate pyrophosphorylase
MTRIRFDGRDPADPLSAPVPGLPCTGGQPYAGLAFPDVPGLDGDSLRARLADARLYLCTGARRDRGDLAEFADAALAGGVDVIQLREKGADGALEARDELAALEVLADACARHGALLAVNDRADIALAAGADVLHLGQDDLPVGWARKVVGDEMVVGRSAHSAAETAAAADEPGVDYFCAGPCWPTPTKPGRPAPGLDLIDTVAGRAPARPWFAIGGIDAARLDAVLAAGAERVVVVRAITEAEDPEAAARSLRARLA